MAIHILKLSVGRNTLTELQEFQQERLKQLKSERKKPELIHVTRSTPKRGAEILAGAGSIYWVMQGHIVGRNKLLEFRSVDRDGMAHCGLVYDKVLVPVKPTPQRPFQGWRYLEGKDAPPDLKDVKGDKEVPAELWKELRALGVL
jgi:hypothetical protein